MAERIGRVCSGRARIVERRADNRKLAGERIRPTEPINLPFVRRAKNTENGLLPPGQIGRQIAFFDEYRLAGSSAHDHTANWVAHAKPPVSEVRQAAARSASFVFQFLECLARRTKTFDPGGNPAIDRYLKKDLLDLIL